MLSLNLIAINMNKNNLAGRQTDRHACNSGHAESIPGPSHYVAMFAMCSKTSVSSFMQMAIELRLLMNEPYIKRWPEV